MDIESAAGMVYMFIQITKLMGTT